MSSGEGRAGKANEPPAPGGVPGGGDDFAMLPERLAILAVGREVRVTATEYRLFALLLAEPGRTFSRAELVERGIGSVVTERTVDAHVKELRRKLGAHGARIETVRFAGYRLQPTRTASAEVATMPEVPSARPRRILFVCVENSNRSQMAEAFARMHGGSRVEAYSAGSRPSGKVNPRAVEFMREVGYDLGQQRSKGLTEFSDVEFDVAVTMGCGDECPLVRAGRREDWGIPDPKEMGPEDFRKVRDLIEQKVKALLAEWQG